jgi:hypothetical protein
MELKLTADHLQNYMFCELIDVKNNNTNVSDYIDLYMEDLDDSLIDIIKCNVSDDYKNTIDTIGVAARCYKIISRCLVKLNYID